jgi:hypothetical protein
LVAAVLIELLLFRMFARTGIYLFKDDTPRWVYDVYQTLVWIGNTLFNFAAILTVLLFAVAAGYLWMRRRTFGGLLPVLAVAMVVWHLALFVVYPSAILSLLYLALSVAMVVASVAASWRAMTRMGRTAMLLLTASFTCVYYFEAIAPLRIAGVSFADHGIGVFQFGEAVAGLAIVAAFVAWGRTRSVRVLAVPAVVGLLMVGSYVSGPERLPLISTWSMGVIMNMPFAAYAVAIPLMLVTILRLSVSGQPLLGFGLALMFFSHRMLPLTYFNMLILGGFLLAAIALNAGRTSRLADGRRTEVLPASLDHSPI